MNSTQEDTMIIKKSSDSKLPPVTKGINYNINIKKLPSMTSGLTKNFHHEEIKME